MSIYPVRYNKYWHAHSCRRTVTHSCIWGNGSPVCLIGKVLQPEGGVEEGGGGGWAGRVARGECPASSVCLCSHQSANVSQCTSNIMVWDCDWAAGAYEWNGMCGNVIWPTFLYCSHPPNGSSIYLSLSHPHTQLKESFQTVVACSRGDDLLITVVAFVIETPWKKHWDMRTISKLFWLVT